VRGTERHLFCTGGSLRHMQWVAGCCALPLGSMNTSSCLRIASQTVHKVTRQVCHIRQPCSARTKMQARKVESIQQLPATFDRFHIDGPAVCLYETLGDVQSQPSATKLPGCTHVTLQFHAHLPTRIRLFTTLHRTTQSTMDSITICK